MHVVLTRRLMLAGFSSPQAAGSPRPLPTQSLANDVTPALSSDPRQAAPQAPALQKTCDGSQDAPEMVLSVQRRHTLPPTPHHGGQLQDTPQTQVVMQRRVSRVPALLDSGGRSEDGTPQTCVAAHRRVARPAASLGLAPAGVAQPALQ